MVPDVGRKLNLGDCLDVYMVLAETIKYSSSPNVIFDLNEIRGILGSYQKSVCDMKYN